MRRTPAFAGGGHDVLRGAALLGGEVLLEAHRVHQVVDDVDVVERRLQRRRRRRDRRGPPRCLVAPRHVRQLVGVARQRPHREAAFQQPRHQAATDIAGGTRDQAPHLLSRHQSPPIVDLYSESRPLWIARTGVGYCRHSRPSHAGATRVTVRPSPVTSERAARVGHVHRQRAAGRVDVEHPHHQRVGPLVAALVHVSAAAALGDRIVRARRRRRSSIRCRSASACPT